MAPLQFDDDDQTPLPMMIDTSTKKNPEAWTTCVNKNKKKKKKLLKSVEKEEAATLSDHPLPLKPQKKKKKERVSNQSSQVSRELLLS